MGIVVKLAFSQKEMTVTNSLDTNKPITPNLQGAYQRVGSKKRGKGYEGTIWAMRPGATKADGSTVSDIEALTTLLHEISHAITMGSLDGKADQEIVSYFINRQQSSKPETNIAGRSDFSVPGSFVVSAIRPLLENNYNQMTPKQQRIYSEIVNLQETVDAYSPKNPNERRAVRFIRRAHEIGMSPEGVQTYKDYTRMAVEFAVDPTGPQGGALLTNLISLPSFFEQIQYGRITGYTIILLFLLATGIFGWRTYILFNLDKNVKKEASGSKQGNNPLSRIFDVAEQNKGSVVETLELKLAEQILVERANIDTGIWLVRLISVVAPLLGLFGTITGMINTFQAITLFGTGDPKTMANGISEALVTTMLGLMTAIPATFMAAIMANYAKNILTVLEEQSTGMVAVASEENRA